MLVLEIERVGSDGVGDESLYFAHGIALCELSECAMTTMGLYWRS